MLFHKEIGNRIFFAIPVVFVAGIVVGLYYCYVVGFLAQCDAAVVVVPSILFHLTLVLMLWSYVMCLCVDPQGVPEGFEEMTQSLLEGIDYNKEDYEKARVNVCEKCHIRRPPRTHHCSLCDKCVLKMDHHCPWVGNCVGFGNHKFFVQFVFYTFLTTLNLGISCASTLESFNFDENPQKLIGAIAGIALSLSLGGLTAYHLYLVLNNKTTLEMMIYERYNVFDTLSKKENFSQVFGKKVIGYILPLKVVKTIDGIVYPLRIRNAEGEALCIKNKLLM